MVAFETVEAAEVYMGRKVRFAEELWLKYTSNKSDYILYCHTTIFSLIIYTVMPLPYIIMDLHKFKIQPKIHNSLGGYCDLFYSFLLTVAPLQILSYPLVQMIGIRTSLPLPSCIEILLQLLVYSVVEDYISYWLHRLLHTTWAFQNIHHVHHQISAPTALATLHAHSAEIFLFGFASFLGPAIVPGHMLTFWFWMILKQMEVVDAHSGYEFPWSPLKLIPFYGGAAYHDYHHFVGGKTRTNFGSLFTYCDFIYRTNKGYSTFSKHKTNGA